MTPDRWAAMRAILLSDGDVDADADVSRCRWMQKCKTGHVSLAWPCHRASNCRSLFVSSHAQRLRRTNVSRPKCPSLQVHHLKHNELSRHRQASRAGNLVITKVAGTFLIAYFPSPWPWMDGLQHLSLLPFGKSQDPPPLNFHPLTVFLFRPSSLPTYPVCRYKVPYLDRYLRCLGNLLKVPT